MSPIFDSAFGVEIFQPLKPEMEFSKILGKAFMFNKIVQSRKSEERSLGSTNLFDEVKVFPNKISRRAKNLLVALFYFFLFLIHL